MIDEEYKENVEQHTFYHHAKIAENSERFGRESARREPYCQIRRRNRVYVSMLLSLMIRVKLQTAVPQISFMWIARKKLTMNTTSSQNFSRSTHSLKNEGDRTPSPTNQKY